MTSVDPHEVATGATDAELAEHYRDRAEGLSADLDITVEKLWKVGGAEGREWVSWNYAKMAERLRREDDVALASAPPPAVSDSLGLRATRLTWSENDEGTTERAVTAIGEYAVKYDCWSGRYAWCPQLHGRNFSGTSFQSKDAAKAAAQADFERRILSCIEPTNAGTSEALRDAFGYIRDSEPVTHEQIEALFSDPDDDEPLGDFIQTHDGDWKKDGHFWWFWRHPDVDAPEAALDEHEPTPSPEPSWHADDIAVDRFAAAMKAKLAEKREEGRGGWDDREQCTAGSLSSMLRQHVDKGDPVDVANFAMMIHQRGERIEASKVQEFVVKVDASPWVEAFQTARQEIVEAMGASWRPITQDDCEIATVQTFGDVVLRNSHPVWVRDADGTVYLAVWTVDQKDRGYWWDIDAESPVDPVEIYPHPLTALTATEGQDG